MNYNEFVSVINVLKEHDDTKGTIYFNSNNKQTDIIVKKKEKEKNFTDASSNVKY